jgi:hypothetical protein
MRPCQLFAIALACHAAACGSSFGVMPDGGGAGGGSSGGAGGGGPLGCQLDASYEYGDIGGFVAYEDRVTLTPPSAYRYTRSPRVTDPPDITCAPAMPACSDAAAIDVADVMAAIHDPAVQAALSAPGNQNGMVAFGSDSRPVDGTVFRIARVGVGEFLVGSPCGTSAGCVAIPAAVTRLMDTLRGLDQQQLQDPSCAALR